MLISCTSIHSSRVPDLTRQTVLNLLLELELKGIVVQHPGKLFALAEPSALRRA